MRNTTPLFLLLFIFFYSCASIVSPTGGPKDELAPVCEKKVPDDNTIKFTATSIDFYFDEFVVLNDVANQFIISPPLDKKPDIKLKGKKVSVVFNEDLKPNTTYTLNFGNAIADYNETNQLQGLSYTFSTGDYIDSLTLSGSVIDGFTLLPEKNIAVGLYEVTEDSTIYKNKPFYLVRPDSSGNFKFNYLRPSVYELVAFEDVNRNLKIEQNERLAFYTSKINLSYENPDSNSYNILLSPQHTERKAQVTTAKELSKGKYEIITAGSKCNVGVIEDGASKKESFITTITGKECDTMMVYTNNDYPDSISMAIRVDTVVENIVIHCNSKQYDKFLLTSQENYLNYDFSRPLKITLANPVFEIREPQLILKEDSLIITDYSIKKDSLNPLAFYINKAWKEDKGYTLVIDKGTIKDIYGQEIDSTTIILKTAAATAFGNLSIVVTNADSSQLIVQLLDNQNKVLQEDVISKTETINYKNRLPGHYFIKVIQDSNKNGRWDGGNYLKRQQPEKVFVSKQSTEVRANWDLTDIIINPEF